MRSPIISVHDSSLASFSLLGICNIQAILCWMAHETKWNLWQKYVIFSHVCVCVFCIEQQTEATAKNNGKPPEQQYSKYWIPNERNIGNKNDHHERKNTLDVNEKRNEEKRRKKNNAIFTFHIAHLIYGVIKPNIFFSFLKAYMEFQWNKTMCEMQSYLYLVHL